MTVIEADFLVTSVPKITFSFQDWYFFRGSLHRGEGNLHWQKAAIFNLRGIQWGKNYKKVGYLERSGILLKKGGFRDKISTKKNEFFIKLDGNM